MRIGVVSDTHGHVPYTRDAVRMLQTLQVEQVLHCGDIGSVEVIELFAPWPTHFVLGNVDYPEAPLAGEIERQQQHFHGRFGELELAGVSIALLHSDDAARFRQAIHSGRYQLVCYGHSHVKQSHHENDTLVLNPGALYRASPHSLAVVELPSLNVSIIDV